MTRIHVFRLLAALPLGTAAPAFALAPEPALTAEKAIDIQQRGVREAVGTAPCPRDRENGDIVVCGRRGADRLPLPVERLPGERGEPLPGEMPRAEAGFSTCVVGCQPTGFRVDVIRTVIVGTKIVRHILGKDD